MIAAIGANKVVLVTGSSSGFGAATAVKFVEKGARKVVITARGLEGLEDTKQRCLEASEDADVFIVKGQSVSHVHYSRSTNKLLIQTQ